MRPMATRAYRERAQRRRSDVVGCLSGYTAMNRKMSMRRGKGRKKWNALHCIALGHIDSVCAGLTCKECKRPHEPADPPGRLNETSGGPGVGNKDERECDPKGLSLALGIDDSGGKRVNAVAGYHGT